jgi:hypothetical protein
MGYYTVCGWHAPLIHVFVISPIFSHFKLEGESRFRKDFARNFDEIWVKIREINERNLGTVPTKVRPGPTRRHVRRAQDARSLGAFSVQERLAARLARVALAVGVEAGPGARARCRGGRIIGANDGARHAGRRGRRAASQEVEGGAGDGRTMHGQCVGNVSGVGARTERRWTVEIYYYMYGTKCIPREAKEEFWPLPTRARPRRATLAHNPYL